MCWPRSAWCKADQNLHILVHGKRPKGVPPKTSFSPSSADWHGGGTGHVAEYGGQAIRELSMDGRMTVCNMTIEGGARAGMIAPDETTFAYLEGRPIRAAREGISRRAGNMAPISTDDGAKFDLTVELQAEKIAPQVTWERIQEW